MKPINPIKNQYRGINAHLHSYWQASDHWHRFRNVYMTDVMKLMQAQLEPLGYSAEIEESVQIRRLDAALRSPRSDILIKDTLPYSRSSTRAAPTPSALTLDQLYEYEIDDEHPYAAIAIYADGDEGEPVAWVELLSPSNKGRGEDAQSYRAKRRLLLDQGLVFVELNFLHEQPPTFAYFSDYSRHEPGSHPYRILILDPRSSFAAGPVQAVEFDVDDPIPVMTIPLNGDDHIRFDFGAAYRKAFEESRYGRRSADYTRLPQHLERYSRDDQARILNRILAVMTAAQQGVNLDDLGEPLPVEDLPLDEARERWQSLTAS